MKKIRDLTVEEIVSKVCGKYGWKMNACKGCPFNYDNHCMKILDFGIIDLDKEIEVEDEKI